MADTSLIFSIIARDKTGMVLKKLQAQAMSTGKIMAMALGPGLLPIAGVGVGAVLSLGTALAGAGVAAGVFGGVLAGAVGDVNDAATKYTDLTDKIQLYGEEAKNAAGLGLDASKYTDMQAKAILELNSRLMLLPPATRDATMAYMDMKSGWKSFVEENKPAVFGILTTGYRAIGSAIGQAQPLFDIGAQAARRLTTALAGWVEGGGVSRFAATARPALDTLTSIIINLGSAVGRTFAAFGSGTGQGILDWINQMTAKWAIWAAQTDRSSKGGIAQFITYVEANGPAVVTMLGQLVAAAVNIVRAVSPLAPISLAIATGLARIIASLPPSVLTALVAGFIAFSAAMKVVAVVQGIQTAAQWAMNAAWLASPVTWIILGIAAVIAIIVLLATKTRFFQDTWNAVWGFIKMIGAWFAGPFTAFWVSAYQRFVAGLVQAKNLIMVAVNFIISYYKGLWTAAKWVFDKITGAGKAYVSFWTSVGGKIKGALSNMFSPLWSGFRGFLNRIIGGWNSLHFGIPGFSFAGISVPGVNIGVPHIPYLDTGGDISRTGLAVVHAGERVVKKAEVRRGGSGGGGGSVGTFKIDEGARGLGRALLEALRLEIRDQGGDVLRVLTPR